MFICPKTTEMRRACWRRRMRAAVGRHILCIKNGGAPERARPILP